MENMMKSWKIVLTVLMVVMLFATACAPAATPAPAAPAAPPAPTAALAAATVAPVAPAAPAAVDPALTSEYSMALVKDSQIDVDTAKYKKAGPYTIGVAGRDPGNGFGNVFQLTVKGYGDELLAKGVLAKPLLVTATNDANKQISDIEDFVNLKVDAIVAAPMSRSALVGTIKRAVDAGIPVVLCTDGIEGTEFTTRVDVNLYEAGYRSGDGLAKILGGKGNIILFHGIAGVDAAETERAGALEALKNYPDIKVLAEEYAQWNIATGKQKTEALMAAHPQIDGVWAGGGEMALGAAMAFRDANKTAPAFAMVNVPNGFLRLAQEFNYKFVAAPDPPSMTKYCLQTAVDILEGKPVKKFIDVRNLMDGASVYDNTDFIKYYVAELNDDFIPPATVDIKNYIDGGFKRK